MQEAVAVEGRPDRRATRRRRSDEGLARKLALAAGLAAILPIVVAVVRALLDGWYPVGDNGLFVIRARDVFSTSHFPFLGTWSSASLTMGLDVNHPGPLLFDLLAVPVRLLPDGTGVALGIAMLDVLVVGGTILGAWRRGGPVLASAAAAVAAALCWSMGSEVLIEPWNPHSMVLPFLCLLVLVWCLVDGDVVVLPAAVAVASLLIQTHLSYGVLVPGLGLVAAVGLGLSLRRRRRRDPDAWPALRRTATRWGLVALAVGLLCWAQPLTEQLFGEGEGNLSRLAEGTTSASEVVGWSRAVRMTGDVTGLPPFWVRPSFAEAWRLDPPLQGLPPSGIALQGLASAAAGLLAVVVALAACAWLARRRRDATAGAAVVVAAAGLLLALASAARVPVSDLGPEYTFAPHQFRWLWAVGAFVTLAVGGTVLRALVSGGRSGRPALVATAALTALTVLVAGLNLPRSDQGTSFLTASIPVMRELDGKIDALADDAPYVIDDLFRRFGDPYGASILAAMQQRDIGFVAETEGLVRQLGEARRFDGENARSRLLLVVGKAAYEPFGGEPDARRLVLQEGLSAEEAQELELLRATLLSDLEARGSLPLNERGRAAVGGGRYPVLERPFDAQTILNSRVLATTYRRGHLDGDAAWTERVRRYADLQVRMDEDTVALFAAPLR